MRLLAVSLGLLLSACATASADGLLREGEPEAFKTNQSLESLERCLTGKLSQQGDVTAVAGQGMTTLVYRVGDGPPMMIDLDPPAVRVTTKFAHKTRRLVKDCI